jgi:hypothetical protein
LDGVKVSGRKAEKKGKLSYPEMTFIISGWGFETGLLEH